MGLKKNYKDYIVSLVLINFFTISIYSQTTNVQFEVNMKWFSKIGNFKPATEFVDLSGNFNNWNSTLLSDSDGDSIYTAIITLNVDQNIEFKARINGLWTGREEFSGGGPNRTYTVVVNGIVNFWYNNEFPSNILSVKVETSTRSIIPGQSVQFFDKSNGSPVSWQWSFPGGIPATSAVQNPVVAYSAEGKYPVVLKIKNAKSDSLLQTMTDYINVSKASIYWWNDAVFYEVFVRSFYDQNNDGKGDLNGLTAKLDYLNDGDSTTHTDLGITAIWLMPVMQSPSYHGYDVTDYRTIESDYGTNADFKAFIQAAHKRGIKVIIDLVMNHTSDQNPWFTQSASSLSSSYRNWYRWSNTNPGGSWHFKNGYYYYAVFDGAMPDLNYAEPNVKAEMFDIARFWLQDMNVDGFRLDAVKYIFETATQTQDVPETFQFWKDFRTSYKSVNPNAFAVGEAWTSTNIAKKYVENKGLDYCFEFSLASALVNAANNADGVNLQTQVEAAMSSYPYLQFGTFLTNHDQERVMSSLGGDVSKAKLAAQLLLSFPGIPFIYYGEEIGTVGPKPDENIRTPMQWNNSANAGFSTVTPWRAPQSDYLTKNIANQQNDNNSLWSVYNKMIQLRNTEPTLRRGNYATIPCNVSSGFVFMRQYGNETIIVASNLSNVAISNLQINLYPGSLAPGSYQCKDLISGKTINIVVSADGGATAQNIGVLNGRSTALYKVVTGSSGLASIDSNSFQVYPIPAKDKITIHVGYQSKVNVCLTISELTGKVIKKAIINESTTLSVSDLHSGIYFLKMDDGKQSVTKKIVINR
jgi:glycosidase